MSISRGQEKPVETSEEVIEIIVPDPELVRAFEAKKKEHEVLSRQAITAATEKKHGLRKMDDLAEKSQQMTGVSIDQTPAFLSSAVPAAEADMKAFIQQIDRVTAFREKNSQTLGFS